MSARLMNDEVEAARGRGGERGATLIEFALISTLMFTLLFGALSYGEILADYVQLRHRLSEIARLVSLGEDATDRLQIFNDIKDDRVAGFMNIPGCSPAFEATSYVAPNSAPIPNSVVGPSITITATYNFGVTGNCRVMPEVFVGLLPNRVRASTSFSVTN
ncbi:TadE/TadG family type IV pilus assembly protein [Zavarzinia aquatilis]|uniref:TadE-like domain-containing protein n=1 Tax=Zavarzinia aquatilis TaxID=2211142 RepID=A0A317E995_9PROT|nr:TadE/TadG family type IV pilus assembly protein [Zavarzinia aquatilis]PWR22796.1 hypothetical protein DKG74_10205 [Zavarzinia aquatilis]